MWSVLDLMGPILGHTPCLWHLTHHSSCRFRRSQAQKSSAQQGATEAVGGNRAQRKKMYLDDDDLQGRIPKESLTRLLLCFQQVPPLSTLIYGQICHEGYQLLGPCQSSSGNGIKTFLHPRRGSECQEHVFPWSTQIIHVFLVGVHASFGCWTKKTCSLDWGKQKPEPQLLYGLICFFFKLWHRFRDIGRCSPCPTANPAIFPMGWATRPGRLGRSISQQLNGFITWGWNQHISSLYLGFSRVLRGLLSGYLWCSLILHFLRDESDEPSINPSCSDVRQSTRVLTQTFGKSVKLRGKPSSISPI